MNQAGANPNTPNSLLAPSLTLGVIELNVADLGAMKTFYSDIIGLKILIESDELVTLGEGGHPLITLHSRTDLLAAVSRHAGLYHLALLFSSRGALARTIYRILQRTRGLFTGAADHLVSEAFYLNDPEGNGIELYFDREKTLWSWNNGSITMATLPIDIAQYLSDYINIDEDGGTIDIGHIHLKVGDTGIARAFYSDVLGFDVTADLPGALFLSVGGYHHHIGMNTWESAGAGERIETLGLQRFAFSLPEGDYKTKLEARLSKANVPVTMQGSTLIISDPWKNTILLT